jgi:hypothetical protein
LSKKAAAGASILRVSDLLAGGCICSIKGRRTEQFRFNGPATQPIDYSGSAWRAAALTVRPHVGKKTVEDCRRCAAVIRELVRERLARGGRLFIVDD